MVDLICSCLTCHKLVNVLHVHVLVAHKKMYQGMWMYVYNLMRVNDCCLTPSEQSLWDIMTRGSYFGEMTLTMSYICMLTALY